MAVLLGVPVLRMCASTTRCGPSTASARASWAARACIVGQVQRQRHQERLQAAEDAELQRLLGLEEKEYLEKEREKLKIKKAASSSSSSQVRRMALLPTLLLGLVHGLLGLVLDLHAQRQPAAAAQP